MGIDDMLKKNADAMKVFAQAAELEENLKENAQVLSIVAEEIGDRAKAKALEAAH